MRPTSPSVGRPFVSLVQVAPPSIVFQIALPGPPPLYPNGVRRRWKEAAYSVSGLSGSMATSTKPVFSSTNLVLVQVLPPSVVLKRPRSLLGPHRWPSAAA